MSNDSKELEKKAKGYFCQHGDSFSDILRGIGYAILAQAAATRENTKKIAEAIDVYKEQTRLNR